MKQITDTHFYWTCIIIGLLTVIFLHPFGDFPLNDDWVYALPVHQWLTTGHVFYPAWLSSFAYIPIIYGILLTKIFGFSFLLLRISTLLFAWASIFLFYQLLRKSGRSPLASSFVSLLLFVNPLFFNLAHTFMTDVPALFLLLLGVYVYYVGFKSNNQWLILCGSLASLLAFFTRQTGIFLLLAGWIYYISQKKFKPWRSIFLFALPCLLAIGLYFLAHDNGLVPGAVNDRFLPFGWSYTMQILKNAWQYILLIFLSIFPITIGILIKNKNWFSRPSLWLFLFVGGVLGYWAFNYQAIFPNLGNVISVYGLGPSVSVMQGGLSNWGPSFAYTLINIIGIIGISLSAFMIWQFWRADRHLDSDWWFWGIFIFFYIALILPIHSFDRYVLVILPFVFYYSAAIMDYFNWSKIVSAGLLIVVFAYSFFGTYNYLGWNKARWKLVERLIIQGISLRDIEGGYEVNGWFLYASTRQVSLGDFTPEWAPWYVKALTPGHLMKYIISFKPLGGYKVIDREWADGIFSNIKFIYTNEVQPHSLE